MTTVARTLVDSSGQLTVHQLANLIHEAAFRNRFDTAATRAAMARANGRRNLARLDAALAAHEQGSAGTRSHLEDHFLHLLDAQGLPPPLVNAHVQTASKEIEVDLHWPERRLCVEVDGPGHRRPRTQRDDREKERALQEAGWEVLRLREGEGVSRVVAAMRR